MNASFSSPVLVVADIHNRIEETEALIARHAPDGRTVVFLGDYFDSYTGGAVDAHLTARWLKGSLAQPNRVHLLGNHDAAYFFHGHPQTTCVGWSEDNQHAIAEVFRDFQAVACKLHMAVVVGPWLLSHAGFSGRQFRGASRAAMLTWANAAMVALKTGNTHPLLEAGLVRGGKAKRGGPLWCDFDDEFSAMPGIHQIMGHTRSRHSVRARQLLESGGIGYGEISAKEVWGRLPKTDQPASRSVNWCIDVESRACATIGTDALVVHFEDSDHRFPAPPDAIGELFPLLRNAGLALRWDDVPPVFVQWDEVRDFVVAKGISQRAEDVFKRSLHEKGALPDDVERALRRGLSFKP